jgi:hypothetical protein
MIRNNEKLFKNLEFVIGHFTNFLHFKNGAVIEDLDWDLTEWPIYVTSMFLAGISWWYQKSN